MGANSAPSVLLLCWRPVHLPLLAAMALSTPRHAMRQRRSCYEALVIRNALATWLSWCWLQVGHGMCNYLLTKPHSLEKFRGMMLIAGRFNATVHLCLVVIWHALVYVLMDDCVPGCVLSVTLASHMTVPTRGDDVP